MSATDPLDMPISAPPSAAKAPFDADVAYARSQLGEVMLQARLRRGVDRVELAARLGLAPSRIARIESGLDALEVVDFFALAVALDYDPIDLFAEAAWSLPDPKLTDAETNLVRLDVQVRPRAGEA